MALTAQQLKANKDYKAGKISDEQYKQAYVKNYTAKKDTGINTLTKKTVSLPKTSTIKAQTQKVALPRLEKMVKTPYDPTGQGVNTKRENRTPREVIPQAPQIDEAQVLKDRLAEESKQRAVSNFQNAFNMTQGRLADEKSALTPKFRTERERIGISDTMARTASEKLQATQGLSRSGARSQSDISQNVLTQGAMSTSRVTESNQRADIERRLSEAQLLKDQGIANAQTDIEINRLTDQLNQLNLAEQRTYSEEQTASDRAYGEQQTADDRAYSEEQLSKDRDYQEGQQIKLNASALEQRDYERQIELENIEIEAEYNEAMKNNDQTRAIELENIRSANDRKLEGLRSANTQAEISLRGKEDRQTNGNVTDDTPKYADEQWETVITNRIDRAINLANHNLIKDLAPEDQTDLGGIPLTINSVQEDEIVKREVTKVIAQSAADLTESQGDTLMNLYGITRKEVKEWLGILDGNLSTTNNPLGLQ